MKSERGALVRGYDRPSGHSVHNTAGDMWGAPGRRPKLNFWQLVCRKQTKKNLDPSPMAKQNFFRVSKNSVGRRGQHLAP